MLVSFKWPKLRPLPAGNSTLTVSIVWVCQGVRRKLEYLDDVIHGATPESHDERLHRVFTALSEHRLTLNTEKCVFSAPAIEYVGFRVSADGISPLQSNVAAILAIPEPNSATQLASFLGMTGYYLKFLPHYSATTAPLRQLLHKEEPWVWSQECSNAVRTLKAHDSPSVSPFRHCQTHLGHLRRKQVWRSRSPLPHGHSVLLSSATQWNGWSYKVPEELAAFSRVKQELSCCVARGLCTVVVYDLHSKWPELIATGSVTSQVIIDFLDSLFARWGLPNTITTDNGPQLISAEFTTYLKAKGIRHIRTAYYHPQANGGVERFHLSLKNSLRAHLVQGWTFSQALRHTLLHYRATHHPHQPTGVSPALLVLGRELRLPLDRLSAGLPQRPQPRVRASVTRQHAARPLTSEPWSGSGSAGPTEDTNSPHIGPSLSKSLAS
ncbi:hypothetical protein ACEWY4_008146 [Coilia grayii]|uniref:Integrase catalytic domain-containing protein n=1 Tax=Coilia grayii TaxID=363190 RepID=A0ABD1KA11_9TELE